MPARDLSQLRADGDLRGRPQGRLSRGQKRHQVITMILAGATEEEVASALSMRPAAVSKIIIGALERWEAEDHASIEHVRTLQLRRIDKLISKLWPNAVGAPERAGGPAREPSVKAVAEIRKLEELRARIAGTEAPKRIDVSGEVFHVLDESEAQKLEQVWAESGGQVIEGTAQEVDLEGVRALVAAND